MYESSLLTTAAIPEYAASKNRSEKAYRMVGYRAGINRVVIYFFIREYI